MNNHPPEFEVRQRPYNRLVKRAMDLAIALPGLFAASPVLLLVSIWIKIDSPGPVFYRGERVGRGGRRFRIFKFRSMIPEAEMVGGPTTSGDDDRLTRSGRFIRRFNIDEIPQLINVIRGEMSVVGPRPDVPSEVAKLTDEKRERILSVRPGMTDWASLRFNNESEIVRGYDDPHEAYESIIRPEKIRLQLRYVENASLRTDLRILFQTFRMVVTGQENIPHKSDPAPGDRTPTDDKIRSGDD